MRQRFALVFNQRAGSIRPLLLDRVLANLRKAGAHIFPVSAASSDEATRMVEQIARNGDADAVIAAGGDGTIRAVAAGLSGTTLPVGIVPLGTGNVMKYEIGLGSGADEIARTLLDGPVITARGGLVNGAPFFLMAGAGFDGRIVAGLNQKMKRVLGRAAYAVPVTRALISGPELFDVEVDGTCYQASWVIVSNAAHYGGSFVLTRQTQLGANQLIAIIVTGKTRSALLAASLALATGRLPYPNTCPKGVIVRAASRVKIGAQTPVYVEVDGDEAGLAPVEITGGGPEVCLIATPAYVADLTNRHTNHLPLAV
ncbi:MAG: diacylglycerol kinase family protein [Hyphomicrobium sp.]